MVVSRKEILSLGKMNLSSKSD